MVGSTFAWCNTHFGRGSGKNVGFVSNVPPKDAPLGGTFLLKFGGWEAQRHFIGPGIHHPYRTKLMAMYGNRERVLTMRGGRA